MVSTSVESTTLSAATAAEKYRHPKETDLFMFEYQLTPFVEETHPIYLQVDRQTQIHQFRAWKNIADPASDTFRHAYDAERDSPKHTVLVVGAGKAGETAAKILSSKGIHVVVVEETELNGGRAGFTIDFLKHRKTQQNAFRDGATVFSGPAIDTVYDMSIEHEAVTKYAKEIGCAAVFWVGGGEENLISTVDYEADGVYKGMSFITHVNEPLMRGEQSLLQIAHEMQYYYDKTTGIPLPTIIQGGGRVGEDVIVKDVAMRTVLALERKARARFNEPEDAVLLERALALIESLDTGKLFGKNSVLEEKLKKLGLTKDDLGSTILQYHDAQEVMKLKVLPEKDIQAEIQARETENAQRKELDTQTTDVLPTDRKSIEKFLRARPTFSKDVVEELSKWQAEFGITIIDRQTIGKTVVEDGQLYSIPIIVDGKTKTEGEKMPAGAIVTAIGFRGVTQVPDDDVKIYYGAMALTGEGALPASMNNVKKIIDENILPDLEKISLPTLDEYKTLQAHIAEIRSRIGDSMTDPVERLFTFGPVKILEDWMILSEGHTLELGTSPESARAALDLERQTRTQALLTGLISEKFPASLLAENPLVFDLQTDGSMKISLDLSSGGVLPLHLAVGADWSLYEEDYSGGVFTRISTIEDLMQLLDRSLSDSRSWGTLPFTHQQELQLFHQFGSKRLQEAKKQFGEGFIYYEPVDTEFNPMLSTALTAVSKMLPWIQTGIRSPGDVVIVPMNLGVGEVEQSLELFINGAPSGLRITHNGLERQFAPAMEWLPVESEVEITGPIYSFTRGQILPSHLTLSQTFSEQINALNRELEIMHHILSGEPLYAIESIRDIPGLLQSELIRIVAEQTEIPERTFKIRVIQMKGKPKVYEFYRTQSGKSERVLRTQIDGTITWGWGYVKHSTNAIKREFERVRRDISRSLLLAERRQPIAATASYVRHVEEVAALIDVSPEGQITISLVDSVSQVKTNRNLRRSISWLRLQTAIATQDEIQQELRQEKYIDSAIYAAAALTGLGVSAGIRYLGNDPSILALISGLGFFAVNTIRSENKSVEQQLHHGSKARSRMRIYRRLGGAAMAFSLALIGDTLVDKALHTADASALGSNLHANDLTANINVTKSIDVVQQAVESSSSPAPTVQGVIFDSTQTVSQVDTSHYRGEWFTPMKNMISLLGDSQGWVNPENSVTQAEFMVDFTLKYRSVLGEERYQTLLQQIIQTKTPAEAIALMPQW